MPRIRKINPRIILFLFFVFICSGLDAQWTKRVQLTFDNSPGSSDWQYRMKITFLNGNQSDDLENFPVLIKLNSDRIDYSHTSDNGEDLRFYDSDGAPIPYEIERWNESGNSYVWVKVPQIDGDSNSDYIWLYYGNPSASDAQDPASVWSNQYEGVWHMGDELEDRTGNDHDGTAYGATESDGVISGATEFSDIDQHVDVGSFDVNPAGEDDNGITLEAWFKVDTFWKNDLRILSKADGHDKNDHYWMLGTVKKDGKKRLRFYLKLGNNTKDLSASSGNLYTDTWYYAAATFNGSKMRLYRNGSQVGSKNKSGVIATDDDISVWIGSNPPDHYRTLDGWIDEVRISNIARSSDWIKAQYKAMTDNFISFGDEEDALSSSSEDLVNFPVLIVLNSSRINYGDVLDAGQDLRFTEPDGTVLPHEIEKWDESGNSFIWVKVPQIDENSTNDYIYMYYGNSSAADWQQPEDVWNSQYKAVWHFNNSLNDATERDNDGTNHGSTDGEGKIGSGRVLDGNSYIQVPHSSSLNLEDMTIEAWIKRNGDNSSKGILEKGNNNQYRLKLGSSNRADMFVSGFGDHQASEGVSDNQWTYLTATYLNSDNGNDVIKIYYDGTLISSSSTGWGTPNTTSSDLIIGAFGSVSNYFNGNVDEVRLSNTVRSFAWTYAQYQSMTDNFVTYGTPETVEEYNLPGDIGGNSWTVCASGGDFTTIQSAINDPSVLTGDTLVICPGTYDENVTVSKSLIIMGEDSSTVIVDAHNSNVPVFSISADNVTLMKMTIQGASSREAVRIKSDTPTASSLTTIRNNIIKDCKYGIRSSGEIRGSVTISNNQISDLADDAVYLYGKSGFASRAMIRNNHIELGTVPNYTYINLIRKFSTVRITDNYLNLDNSNSYLVYGRDLDTLIVNSNTSPGDNNIRGGIYARDISEYIQVISNTFPKAYLGAYTVNSGSVMPDIILQNNNLTGAYGYGIFIDQGDSVVIKNNQCQAGNGVTQAYRSILVNQFASSLLVENNDVGTNNISREAIIVKYGTNATVKDNRIHGVAYKGIYPYAITGELIVTGNDADSCKYGYYQSGSAPTIARIENNDFSLSYYSGISSNSIGTDSLFIKNNHCEAAADGYQSSNSIWVKGAHYALIENNIVGTNTSSKDALDLQYFDSLIVKNNTSLYSNDDFIDAENISDYLEITGNTGHENNTGIEIDKGSPTSIIIKNNLIYNSDNYGIYVKYGDSLSVINNTLDNCYKAIYFRNQTAVFKNNIITNNHYGIYRGSGSKPVSVDYNDLYGNDTDYHNVSPGTGNIGVDPLFVSSSDGDYHLQSQYGSYHGGAWTPDANHSECIDAGDPGDDYLTEPYPNGSRINMGAYGNTAQASLSAGVEQFEFSGFPRQIYVFLGLPAHPTDGTPAGDPAGIVGDDFGGNPGEYTGWRVSHWNSPRRTYDRYGENDWDPYAGEVLPDSSDLEPPDFSPGIGFWVWQNAQDNPSITFNGYEVNPNESYEIDLEAPTGESGPDGFNQLANPLNSQMDWSECQITDGNETYSIINAADLGWINPYAYTYNWEDNYYLIIDPNLSSDAIDSWDGFWCTQLVDSLDLTLLVPPGAAISKPIAEDKNPEQLFKGKTTFAKVPQFTEGWFLQLSVEQVNGNHKDIYSGIGVHPQASDRFDQYDAFEQPIPAPEYVEIFFPHHIPDAYGYWEEKPEVLSYDIQSTDFTEAKWWMFVVFQYNLPGEYAISWPNLNSLPGYVKLSLWDGYGNELISDLRNASNYRFNTGENQWNYFWIKAEIAEDTTPPDFFVGYIQNPIFTSDLALYVLPSERLSKLNVSVLQPDNTPVYIAMSDEINNVYAGKYSLSQSGSFTVRVEGSDITGNTNTTEFSLVAELAKPSAQIVAISEDEKLQVTVPPNSSRKPFYLLIEEKGHDGLAKPVGAEITDNIIYSIHPTGKKLDNPALISFNLDLSLYSTEDLTHLGIARQQDGEWVFLPTEIHPASGRVEAQTFEFGDFQLIFDKEANPGRIIPENFSLKQNYPNPFNSSTVIEYSVPTQTHVRLSIYNILGQEVITLVDEIRKPGSYRLRWDGYNKDKQRVASGMYLLRMEAGKYHSVKKLTLTQ